MWKELFESGSLMDLPVLVMLAFMAIFVGVVVWAFSKRRRPHYDRMANLPLEDD